MSARASRLVRALLFAYAIALGVELGGSVFDALVIAPMWTGSVEAARRWNGDPLFMIRGGRFVLAGMGAALALAVAVGAAGEVAGRGALGGGPAPLRRWLRLGAWPYPVLVLLVWRYFLPEQWAIKGPGAEGRPDAELASRAHTWMVLNWARLGVTAAMLASTLHALGLSYRVTPNGERPTSPDNQ